MLTSSFVFCSLKIEYSYDANGNLTRKEENGNVTTYQYDEENRLIGGSTPSGAVSFKYDELGRRISKTANSFTDNWIYDGNEVIEDNNSRIYIHGRSIDERVAFAESGINSYYLTDALGSVRGITDSTGLESQSYTYKDFGKIKSESGSINNRYAFTAREYDSEIGLYYYRARYYDSILGRFISADPIGFEGGINLYSYVENNPNKYTDPLGMIKVRCLLCYVGYYTELFIIQYLMPPGVDTTWLEFRASQRFERCKEKHCKKRDCDNDDKEDEFFNRNLPVPWGGPGHSPPGLPVPWGGPGHTPPTESIDVGL